MDSAPGGRQLGSLWHFARGQLVARRATPPRVARRNNLIIKLTKIKKAAPAAVLTVARSRARRTLISPINWLKIK